MTTSHTTTKGDRRPEIYPVGDLPNKPDILERSLGTPSSFGSGPTIMNSRLTVPTYQGEGSISPDTVTNRPKDTPMIKLATTLAPTGTSLETTQHTRAPDFGTDDPLQLRERRWMLPDSSLFRSPNRQSPPMSPPSAQALPNSSLASPILGFHAWNESEKSSALIAVNSLKTIIQGVILPSSHSVDDLNEKLLDASLSSYLEFVNYLVESRLPERAGSLQARAICLVVLAGVAIFLGVVQLLTVALMAGADVIATGQNNSSTTVGKVINIFAFCGISFDTLGAMFALWTFRSLILTISKIEKIVFEKQNLNMNIHFTLDTFCRALPSIADDTPQKNNTPSINLVKLFADFQQSSTKHHMEARGWCT